MFSRQSLSAFLLGSRDQSEAVRSSTQERLNPVSILNQLLATRIGIRLKKNGSERTDVSVSSECTALDPAANDHVKALAKGDAGNAAEWRTGINAYGK